MSVSQVSEFLRTVPVVLATVLMASCMSGPAPENPAAPSQAEAEQPSIEGTYRLVSRELPDGTRLLEPDVTGLFTYTKTRRNFNIAARDETGQTFNSRVAEYRLGPSGYSEMHVFSVANDETDRNRVIYTRTDATESVPVQVEGDRIEFQPEGEPVLVFEGTRLTATMEDEFIDVWERVE